MVQGMVDPGENRTATLMREFGEEALNMLEAGAEEKAHMQQLLAQFFQDGHKVGANCW